MEGIQHVGSVIDIKRDHALITLMDEAACQTCSAKGVCGVNESDKKTFILPVENLKNGDQVRLEISNQTALHAMFLAYFLPFLLALSTLIVSIALGLGEGLSGLFALVILPVYYLVLHFVHPDSFQIKVHKI